MNVQYRIVSSLGNGRRPLVFGSRRERLTRVKPGKDMTVLELFRRHRIERPAGIPHFLERMAQQKAEGRQSVVVGTLLGALLDDQRQQVER